MWLKYLGVAPLIVKSGHWRCITRRFIHLTVVGDLMSSEVRDVALEMRVYRSLLHERNGRKCFIFLRWLRLRRRSLKHVGLRAFLFGVSEESVEYLSYSCLPALLHLSPVAYSFLPELIHFRFQLYRCLGRSESNANQWSVDRAESNANQQSVGRWVGRSVWAVDTHTKSGAYIIISNAPRLLYCLVW